MATQLIDGTGSKRKAKITQNNELLTDSIVKSSRDQQALDGEAYIVGSGFVTLTSDLPSAILYFKNDGQDDLIITRFLVGVRSSVGATTTENHVRGIIYKNPTGMTSGTGLDLSINNINFGSSNTIDSTSEIGQEAAALVGGSPYLATVAPVEQLTSEEAATILPRGTSIGVLVIPPAGNSTGTGIQVSVGINVHKKRI